MRGEIQLTITNRLIEADPKKNMDFDWIEGASARIVTIYNDTTLLELTSGIQDAKTGLAMQRWFKSDLIKPVARRVGEYCNAYRRFALERNQGNDHFWRYADSTHQIDSMFLCDNEAEKRRLLQSKLDRQLYELNEKIEANTNSILELLKRTESIYAHIIAIESKLNNNNNTRITQTDQFEQYSSRLSVEKVRENW